MEEDIKILEDLLNRLKYNISLGIVNAWKPNETFANALENLINRNKELEEENEIYKEELEKIDKVLNLEAGRTAPYRYEIIESLQRGITQLKKIIDNSIPVSLVEETIEELKQEYKIELEKNSIKAFILKCQIQILQELLEG